MEIDALNTVKKVPEPSAPEIRHTDTGSGSRVQKAEAKLVSNAMQTQNGDKDGEQKMPFDGKEPSKSSIDSAVSDANNRMTSTRCEYSYDEDTKRVSIKVFDKDNDELIREVPPEESLEMLQKMWEIAGLIVDEKR